MDSILPPKLHELQTPLTKRDIESIRLDIKVCTSSIEGCRRQIFTSF
jgi:hypothetical protein